MSYPTKYRYTKEHEWVELTSDQQVKIGITDHAQSALGDIVFLELPKAGRELKAHETFGVVESIKAVSDLYSPIQGKVVQINADLVADPGKINSNPHGEWMIILESPEAKAHFNALLDSTQYSSFVSSL